MAPEAPLLVRYVLGYLPVGATYLRAARPSHGLTNFSDGGQAALEDCLTTLLQGARWSVFAWHNFTSGGAASCWNQKPGLPYFKGWGGWASTGVAMRSLTMMCWTRTPF